MDALLERALQSQRTGLLDERVREHPRLARWLIRRQWSLICATAGVARTPQNLPFASGVTLRWLVTQLRPDGRADFAGIAEAAWLNLSSWRPMLAMASHLGLLTVPDFPRRYRRRSEESALDNLCGLWGVGPSTVYRTLERARELMAALLRNPSPGVQRLLALREVTAAKWVAGDVLGAAPDTSALAAWHLERATRSKVDAASTLWHHAMARDTAGFAAHLRQHSGTLASGAETELLWHRMLALPNTPRQQVDLQLARAALARTCNQSEREQVAYEDARQVAQTTRDPLLLGIVHSALGKFFELRDADRAFACYQDSAEFLRDLGPERGDVDALEHFITTYARLAWLYLLRNDARSKVALDRAEGLRAQHPVPDEVLGVLEQVWGQYWRRVGDLAQALDHRFRALNIFERLGDSRSVLLTCMNIGFDLAEQGDHARAAVYSQRVLQAARTSMVEPVVLIGAITNLGASAFWQHDHDAAIEAYGRALIECLACDQPFLTFRTRYNLAEAHFHRFLIHRDPLDEEIGDRYVQEALATRGSGSSPAAMESARKLKQSVLDSSAAAPTNRMLPGEDAIHLEQMNVVHRHREILSVPGEPTQHAAAHLAIAAAYAAIAAKERGSAVALVQAHGLQKRFAQEFLALYDTFNREISREQQLAAAWKQAAADLVADASRSTLLACLLDDGAINKSAYAQLCSVSPATASKHLGLLTERGLLVQMGKGPSTRYELPR